MTVIFLNKSKLPPAVRPKTALLAKAVTAALKPFKAKGEVTVVFMGDSEMRRLNKERLNHDYITDVIAFPYETPSSRLREEGRGGEFPFGDIVICVPQAARQAKELDHPLLKELLTLAVHGALHLVGFDDHTPAAKKKMFQRQDALVSRLTP